MRRIFRFFKQLLCDHIYGDGIMNPFVDVRGNHSAIYTCINCGHKEFKTFERK